MESKREFHKILHKIQASREDWAGRKKLRKSWPPKPAWIWTIHLLKV